jgi:DNA replication protein DnaC
MTDLRKLAGTLGFRAIEAHWSEYADAPWLQNLLEAEQKERDSRGLQRRLKEAVIGQFKPMSEFDWSWPKQIDRIQIEDLFSLEFIEKSENVILIATNGLGKTMIAQNLTYQAVMAGYSALFVKASVMLDVLMQAKEGAARKRVLSKLCRVSLLCVDEVGYMSYSHHYADLLFQVIAGRYQKRATIVTTNKIFKAWSEIFPSATCIAAMVDQLVHHSDIITIMGNSWRHHEAEERAAEKEQLRQTKAAQRKSKKQSQ